VTASAETIGAPAVLTDGGVAERNGTVAPPGAAVPPPVRAGGVELLGEVEGSGYRRRPALVRRADGQTIQLTPLLYQLLAAIDGKRGYVELAETLSERSGRLATAEDVRFLTEAKLRPFGLLRRPDGTEPHVVKSNPLLGLRLKRVVSNPTITNRIAAPFTAFFRWPVALAVVIGFAATIWWIVFEKGLASPAHQALYEPEFLLLVFGLMLLSTAFHEIGHAAACRFSGAKPGGMGVGLYLVWPAFYTDVTDSYRLGRGGRLRVDLGGMYFNAIFGLAMLGLWAAVGWDALLLVVVAQLLQIVRQLVPIVRFDGYHVLADLTGVPDLFQHIKPTLLGLLPRRGRARGNPLKPWARAVVTLWVFIVVPLLGAILAFIVLVLPRILATAWDSLGLQWSAVEVNWAHEDVSAVAVGLLSILAVSLPVLGIAYLLISLVRSASRRMWRATAGRPPLRAAALLAGATLVASLAWAWWPGDQYRPIEPGERLGLSDAYRFPDIDPFTQFLSYGSVDAEPVPAETTAESGHWVLVLVPQTDAPSLVGTPPSSDWIFPFDRPRQPREGDNQALAVNTEDGSRVVDVALALVWVTDGGPVDQWNEAYALASCTGCETTAIAFQTVIIVGYAQIVTPGNAAVAFNYLCVECRTQALALQLIATLGGMPDDEALAALAQVWMQLDQLSQNFELVSIEQIYTDLVAAQTAILEILEPYQASTTTSTAAADPTVIDDATEPATVQETTTAETTTTTTTTSTTSEAPAPAQEDAGTSTGDGAGTTTEGTATTTTESTTPPPPPPP
jgi:putative peptide zinc metalloprotease protein